MAPQAIDPIAAKFGGTAVAPAEPAVDPIAQKYGGTIDPIAAKWGGTPDGTRPAPIQVDRGFTTGVKVTGPADSFGPTLGAPPAAAAPAPAPVRLGSAKTGGGATATPNFMDVPTEGVTQIARGAGALLSHPAVLPTEPHVIAASAPGKDEATYNALADLLEGAGKAASPLAVAGAIVDLPGTVLTLGLSYLTASAAGGAARLAQASPAVQRFVTALAGSATALGLGARQIGQLKTKAADVLAKQAADARAVVAQAQAHDAAYDAANPPPPEEPIPVGRGATDAAAAAKPKLEAVNDVLPPSPEPGAPPPAPPALDIDAAIRDLAAAEPSSPQALTAIAALQRAGLDLPTITARVQQARATPPAAVPAPSERPRMVNGPYVDPTAAKFGGEPVAPVPPVAANEGGVAPAQPTTAEAALARLTDSMPLVERRQTTGESPSGVERRNAPLDLRDPVAAAAQMRAENPNIDAEAKALAARARETRTPAAPRAEPLPVADPVAEKFGGVPEPVAALSTQTEQALPPAQMNTADIKAEIASHDERPVAAERLTALQQELAGRKPAKGAETPPTAAADDRKILIDRIVAAARKPAPTIGRTPTSSTSILPVTESKGTDGKWYRGGNFPTGVNVAQPHEQRTIGYSIESEQGTRVGTIEKTAEAVLDRWKAAQTRTDDDMRQHLEQESPERLASQAAHWLKEDAPKPKAPAVGDIVTVKGQRGIVRALVTAGKKGGKGVHRLRDRARVLFKDDKTGQFYEQHVDLDQLAVAPSVPPPIESPTIEDTHEGAAQAPAGPIEGNSRGQLHDPARRRVLTKEERADRRRAREDTRAEAARLEQQDLDDLVARAQRDGFTGDPAVLRAELVDRLQGIKEVNAEFDQSGTNGLVLLRAIAQLGGLSLKAAAAAGQRGELAWLKEFQDRRPSTSRKNLKAPDISVSGQIRGVRGVFRESTAQTRGGRAGGQSLDGMLTKLQQDPRFYHLTTTDELTDAIRSAAMGREDSKDAIASLNGWLASQTWDAIGTATHEPDEYPGDADAFDPVALEAESAAAAKPVADVLDTGEEQPRLPGAEDARQVGKAETSFRAPVQASGGDFSLETPLTDAQKADDAKRADGPSMFDDVEQDVDAMEVEEPRSRGPSRFEDDLNDLRRTSASRNPIRRYMARPEKYMRKWAATLLGVDPQADAAEVRTAYRAAVRANHPDVNAIADPSRMADVNVAGQWLLKHPAAQIADVEQRVGAAEDAHKLTFTELRALSEKLATYYLLNASTIRFSPEYPVITARLAAVKARIDAAYAVLARTPHADQDRVRNERRFMAEASSVDLGDGDATQHTTFGELAFGEGLDIDALQNNAAFQRVAKATRLVIDDVLSAFPAIEATIGVRGLMLKPKAFAVHVSDVVRDGKPTNAIFVNPLEPLRRANATPATAASLILHAILHEITHGTVDDEDEAFIYTLGMNYGTLGADREVRALRVLQEAYRDGSIVGRQKLASGLTEAVRLYSAPRGNGRGTNGHPGGDRRYSRRPEDQSGDEADVPRGAPQDSARTVTTSELKRLADRLRTSVEVQRARAEAAGYTVRDAAPPIAQATLIPGLGQFTERDVVPALKTATKDVTEAHSAIRALWAPARVSESAETMAAIMRPNLALRRQRDAMARKNMRKLEVAWDRMPRAAQLAFAMAVDEGAVDTLPASQQELAKLLNSINSHKRHEANALGGKVGYIEHYFPREWVKPGKVREFVMRALYGKRPLQGRAGFKKARARDKETGDVFSFRTLHKAGFEPVSYNPITAHLRKWTEMDKWIAARRILLEAKQYGVATFVRVGDKPPEGETRYPESFGTVYGPPTIEVKEAYDAGLMEALHRFATEQGITTVRRLNLGGKKWGYHVRKGSRSEIHTRFGGPEGVLMHEIGHALDASHGLGEKIGLAQSSERREEINFAETPSKVIKELRALADLRLEKESSKHFRQYVRNRAEVIANLVHAFLYAPDLARQVAPNAYWALYNLAKDTPDLRGLLDIQKARSLRVGVNTAVARIDGKVIKGYYYGPQDAVRLLDNYLSPGLRGNVAYDLYRAAGNFLNQVQLGLSVFHVLTTATNSTISRGALALEQASRGQVGPALKNAAITATLIGPPILDVIRGHRYLKAFYAKDAQFRELVHEADIIAKGGGGVGWDTFWHSSAPEQFLQAIRGTVAEAKAGNYPGALVRAGYAGWRTIPAAIELLAKPVMEWWVPRLKLAAFLDLARMELRDLGPRPDPLEAGKVLGKAWDSIDNRFGELIYDNIFWHGILKDAGMASVRALGWNLGTVREVFGAIPAQAAQFGLLPGAGGGGGIGKPPQRLRNTGFTPDPDGGADIPVYERGRAPWLTHQFAYFMALLYVGAVMGAIYQYLHTGKRPGETDDGSTDPSLLLLDLYFPRTGAFKKDGRPERATLWTYMKDVFAFMRHPLDTAAGKLHPALSLAIDIIRNEDYFGNAMRNGDDPFIQQATDIFAFIGKQYQPISVKNFAERKAEKGESGIGPFESFLGINVAPQKVTRTAAEDYLRSIAPATHRTKEEAVKAEARRDLRAARQDGDGEAARAAVTAGNLSRRSILLSAHSARQTALQRTFQSTTLAQAIHAYELATPEERAELRTPLARKWHSLFKDVAPDAKRAMADRFGAAIKLPVARLGASARPAVAATR